MSRSHEQEVDALAVGSIELLSKRARSLVLEEVRPDERPSPASWLCIVGDSGHALVALASRLLVVKAGLTARLTLSDELESFAYSEIDEIGLVVGQINSVIEVRSTSLQAAGREWWQARDPNEDPLKAMNSIVIRTARLGEYEAHIEELRRRVAEFRRRETPGAPDISILERLAALHSAGSLSDEEFERAKKKLLG
jgi:hypothetical protein